MRNAAGKHTQRCQLLLTGQSAFQLLLLAQQMQPLQFPSQSHRINFQDLSLQGGEFPGFYIQNRQHPQHPPVTVHQRNPKVRFRFYLHKTGFAKLRSKPRGQLKQSIFANDHFTGSACQRNGFHRHCPMDTQKGKLPFHFLTHKYRRHLK